MTRSIFIKGIHPEFEGHQYLPKIEDDFPSIQEILPAKLRRKEEIAIPNVPEVEIIRHFTELSANNYSVDKGIYPLGSCTMKYNPRINEKIAKLPGFANVHPLQEKNDGSITLIYELGQDLCTICGMDAFTMLPSAGAHGELVGMFIIKKYFEIKGEKRTKIIVPDSAHGTNPASATMAGFSIIELVSNSDGEIDLHALEEAMQSGDIAGLMLTNPNTLGVFDRNILKITSIVHSYGGLCYYDGANLNPILGICRPGDMGFDIIHINLHKTFSTPHGGGGPGSGPVGVKKYLQDYLPCPQIVKNESGLACVENSKKSVGKIRSFWGNFGVLVKAYSYIQSLGQKGLRRVAENAVLNANYLRCALREMYKVPFDRINMHEFVLDVHLPNEINAEDVAKGLLDRGLYSPTIYFPLIIHEAMMIEPTETETKDNLDQFIKAMQEIYEEATKDAQALKRGPHKTPIGRLDATLAAKKPILHD